MGTDIVQYSIPDVEKMATAIAKSQLFGIKTVEQAMALMLIAQAEGRHPVEAARDYNIIAGRPSKTAEAMLRDFLQSGGKVEWHELTDKKADATFTHPMGGSIKIDWDMTRAKTAGLGAKDMWVKYPRQMLRSRVISEGVRSVYPAATSGMYVPEEVRDFDNAPMKDITPSPKPEIVKPEPVVVPHHPETGELSPHTLAYTNAVEFGKVIAAAIQASKNDAEVTDWLGQNEVHLKTLETASPKMKKRIDELAAKQRAGFVVDENMPPFLQQTVTATTQT